jgi:hypothetical protein
MAYFPRRISILACMKTEEEEDANIPQFQAGSRGVFPLVLS